MNKQYFTPQEAADILKVERKTIYRWIKEGIIEASQSTRKGAIRIHLLDLPSYARKNE